MLKNMSIKKIMVATSAILILVIMYLLPDSSIKEIDLDKSSIEYVYDNIVSTIYLVDSEDYVARTSITSCNCSTLDKVKDLADGLIIDGKNITKMKNEELTEYRRNDIGFVFQFYNLVQNLTVLENVELATQIAKKPFDPKEMLEKVGLGERLNNFPGQISGGEQQRASIARAICKNPKILLCDEPTGALDYKTGKMILSLLQDINRLYHITIIIVTHNSLIKGIGNKVISFKSGKVIDVKVNEKIEKADEIEW